jgi:hypothetical protein
MGVHGSLQRARRRRYSTRIHVGAFVAASQMLLLLVVVEEVLLGFLLEYSEPC